MPAEAEKVRASYGPRAEVRANIAVEDLPSALEGRSTWFFMGHGDAPLHGQKVPAFTKNGQIQSVTIDAVVAAVKPYALHGHLKTIVFNGCCTYELCRALHEHAGVENIVCWRTLLCDEAGATFGSALAHAMVSNGERLDAAFEEAKSKVLNITEYGCLDNGIPGHMQKFQL